LLLNCFVEILLDDNLNENAFYFIDFVSTLVVAVVVVDGHVILDVC